MILLLTIYMTVDKWFSFFVPQFPHLYNADVIEPDLQGYED